ncbi:MAG: response regulator [Mariprofundaceae bacterium]|nr:response regulator [Mariprofundaceae bacterium]
MIHVIDDDMMFFRLIEYMLGGTGHEIFCFMSGEEYLEYLHSPLFQKPSIILCDIRLPETGGHDLVLEIRKKLPFQKIVQINNDTGTDRNQHTESQLCYMLYKPVPYRYFISVINSLSACEDAQKSEAASEYSLKCAFGLNHACPFHESKRLNPA